jgi:hypothetical protein
MPSAKPLTGQGNLTSVNDHTAQIRNSSAARECEVRERYWGRSPELITRLPIPRAEESEQECLPPLVEMIDLPPWASDCAADGGLLVPSRFVVAGQGSAWERTDWFGVIHWYLQGLAERAFEAAHGPIHSYSLRLKGWDARLWSRAWVNRAALFLRRWAAVHANEDEQRLFGALPQPEVILTHDVDAVRKTPAIRCKQAAFRSFHALRKIAQGKPVEALFEVREAYRFFACPASYWCFDEILRIEEAASVKSHFLFYGGIGGWKRSPVEILMDPAYNVEEQRLQNLLRSLHARGWKIGLHPSFNTWSDPGPILGECRRLENALQADVKTCRQHWLRFSWSRTWAAQAAAGLEKDFTLGFNDRPGFRNGAALGFHPLNGMLGSPLSITVYPMVLMDSHLYDYRDMSDGSRKKEIRYWMDEIRAVRGIGSVIWHQQVFSEDYGWGHGYRYLIELLTRSTGDKDSMPAARAGKW